MNHTHYLVNNKTERIIAMALTLLEKQLKVTTYQFTKTSYAINYLTLLLSNKEREQFEVLYLDNQNKLIARETVFIGTINKVDIYPREIAKQALKYNAAAVILAHNHPSGDPEPSQAKRIIILPKR